MSASLDLEYESEKAREALQEEQDGKLADLPAEGITPANTKVAER